MQQDNKFRNNENLPPDCILCAAGSSGRMGDWKPLLPWKETTLVESAVQSALEAGCRVILVTGKRHEELEERFRGRENVLLVLNEAWESGMVSSIRLGAIHVVSPYFFVAHSDMPMIPESLYRTLLSKAEQSRTGRTGQNVQPCTWRPRAWRPRYQGNPGHPVLFDSTVLPLIAAMGDGESMKGIFADCELRFLETGEPFSLLDLDDSGGYLSELARSGRCAEKGYDLVEKNAVLVTGPRSAGKTCFVRQAFFRSVTQNLPSVLISQVPTGRTADGQATGFDMEMMAYFGGEASSFKTMPLARLSATLESFGDFSLVLGPYRFDEAVFEAALVWVQDFINRTDKRSVFFAVDEIGKLELLRSVGLLHVLETIVPAVKAIRDEGYDAFLFCAARYDTIEEFERFLKTAALDSRRLFIDASHKPERVIFPFHGQ